MRTLRARRIRMAVIWCPALLASGCENSTRITANLPDASAVVPIDAEVFDALAKVVSADRVEPADSDADEAPGFGDDPALLAPTIEQAAMEFDDTSTFAEFAGETVEPIATGLLMGRFVNDRPESTSDASNGAFRGQWTNADGDVIGSIRGEYFALRGVDLPDPLIGGGVFRGKLIDLDGRFLGFLHGRYGHAPNEQSLFYGRWFDRAMRVVGVMRGRWLDDPAINGGQFGGEWAAFDPCAVGEALPDIAFEDGDFGGFDTTPETVDPAAFVAAIAPMLVELADADTAPAPPCVDPNQPFGFLRGWHVAAPPTDDNPPPLDGGFSGHWATAAGQVHGALIGRWEIIDEAGPADGDDAPPAFARLGLFHGKIVNADGQVIGFLRGVFGVRWYGLGVFRGEYFDSSGGPQGHVRGRWDDAPRRPGGPFFGTWNGLELPQLTP